MRLINVWRLSYFNPRTPVGCDTHRLRTRWRFSNFNPRTPVGCDRSGLRGRGGFVEISIHAPQWGATTVDATITPILRFQSTHPSGVRPTATRTAIRVCNFNPRTPVGCDDPSRRRLFQSTHPSGVRRFLPTFCPHYSGFQSTHPSGVRPAAGSPHGSRSYFNPRTPVGCDTPSAIQSFHCLEFQSTHPSGVRLTPPESRSHSAIFQSTHPSGVRPTGADTF